MATLTWATATKQRGVRKYEARLALNGMFTGAVTTSSVFRFVVPTHGRIGSVVIHAAGAGSGAGNTQIDVRKNGVSVLQGSSRFSIASADTGIFNGPDWGTDLGVRPGDTIEIAVTAIPATAGHQNVSFIVVIV